MKVRTIELKHFKRFQNKKLDFTDPATGLAKNLIVLLGENGSGKSTILQAIAATLGTVTCRLESPSDLVWPGFNYSLVDTAWPIASQVELEIEFSPAEIQATLDYFRKVPGLSEHPEAIPPAQSKQVTLVAEKGKVRTRAQAERVQFRGREYAKQIYKSVPEGANIFKNVGFVFWYTENREAASLTPMEENGQPIRFDMDMLRRRLADLLDFHERKERGDYQLRSGQRDFFADLEKAYKAVFPGRKFEGKVPRLGDELFAEPWFYMYDGHRSYELFEMSGGERAIFPILLDFVNWDVHKSVVLIDEIELHLHPPLQQSLLRALEQLGTDNQFIITTHSNAIENLVPNEAIYRLEVD